MKRGASIERKTKETDIKIKWELDGSGKAAIKSGIPFFDHMLELFARHGFFDLEIEARGDIEVDHHHTIEDTGIGMGRALRDALVDFGGIKRYGHAMVPMDEALCLFVIDISGRPTLVFNGGIEGFTGDFDAALVKEFFRGFVNEARVTIHINLFYGENIHHKVESIFKAFGRTLKEAVTEDKAIKGPLSTKGVI
ncbi:MAG: imidazoleglycerol-phosphate dehydratase HisB [Syntrophorhabdaceae bacterium]|nr:imidazoleglycerol-phosphate dehydratase HisB [Syntrophorhabdales bacterium]MBP9560500.1 imidazoleglycerol-phosphate dehydratase HisB [Syntrophorhabdaceae bacterium]